jgi:AraC family transcriptional regulator
MTPSLDAHRYLKASMRLSSWEAGWRSVLLREFLDEPSAAEFTTAATADYFLSLVTSGSCRIESWREGRWHATEHRVGGLGMRSPGVASTLRWTSCEPHKTLQLYLPAEPFDETRAALGNRASLPPQCFLDDPLVAAVMVAMKEGLIAGAPDLYAETSAQLLAAHLLHRHAGASAVCAFRREDRRLERADAYLRAHLADPVSLAAIAKAAGLSRFHLLRLFKQTYGETPLRRLTQFRMAEAKRLLLRSRASVTEIGLSCGYGNPANFAAAFRRQTGVSPRAFRSWRPTEAAA